jgi:hypothetical protein
LLRDTPVFEEDDEESEGDDLIVPNPHVNIRDHDEMDNSSRSEDDSKQDSASELPPSRIHSKMPLHKKILSTSQQGANML